MKAASLFVYSVGVILLLASVAKLISSFGNASILHLCDPLTGLQFQTLFRIVGGIEIVVALACILNRQIWLPVGLAAWLATSFLGYRIGLWWIGWHRPCSCLGNLTDALHIPPQTADMSMKIILTYLLFGSYATLFWLWRQKRKAVSALAPSDPSATSPAP